MSNTETTQAVTVDHGDLLEACQSANAWASLLRERARRARMEFGALPIADEDVKRYSEAADRIDAAVARLQRSSYESVKAQRNG